MLNQRCSEMFITESVMTRNVKIKVGWYSSEHRWKRKNLWIIAENDWISMRAQAGTNVDIVSNLIQTRNFKPKSSMLLNYTLKTLIHFHRGNHSSVRKTRLKDAYMFLMLKSSVLKGNFENLNSKKSCWLKISGRSFRAQGSPDFDKTWVETLLEIGVLALLN